MANIVQRNLQKSLATSMVAVQKETGIPMPELVEIFNQKFGYVAKENPTAVKLLTTQVELDAAAEKHAQDNKVVVSKTAVVLTALERMSGTLSGQIQSTAPQPQ